MRITARGCRMNAVAIPSDELKRETWYYGVRCSSDRVLALVEDSFAGRGDDKHLSAIPLLVRCECGTITNAHVLHKFKTPLNGELARPTCNLAVTAHADQAWLAALYGR
jgi:hypothetical protein